MQLGGIMQIALSVDDISRAVPFYRDTLGLKLLFEAPPALAFFDCDGVRLMLSGVKEEERRSAAIYFRVSGIEKVHAELASRGVRFVEDPHCIARLPHAEVWLAAFDDGEGNFLAIMEER
jgi:methylmalonyl-CoA/ethylmalonyl-CoA epimerase